MWPRLSKHITHAIDQWENKAHSLLFQWWLPPEHFGPSLSCFAMQILKSLEVASLFWNACPLFQGNCLLNGDQLNTRTLLSWKREEHMRRGTLAVSLIMQALTQPGVSLSNPAPTFYMMIDNLEL